MGECGDCSTQKGENEMKRFFGLMLAVLLFIGCTEDKPKLYRIKMYAGNYEVATATVDRYRSGGDWISFTVQGKYYCFTGSFLVEQIQ